MPHVSYESAIKAPMDLVWELLHEKAEHPERFYPGLREAKILERHGDGFLRQVTTEVGEVRTERLVSDRRNMQITATLVDHPVYSGTSSCQVSPMAEGPLLRCDLDWSPNSGNEPTGADDLGEVVLAGLRSMIERAERGADEPEAVGA